MPENPGFGDPGSEPDRRHLRRTSLGVLAGGGLFVAIMLLLAGTAVAFGWIRGGEGGQVDLGPWLTLEILGGSAASVLAGAASRRVAGRYRAPAVLAALIFTVGLLEATEILRSAAAGVTETQTWLVLLAPIVAGAGVLLGGWRPAGRSGRSSTRQRRICMSEGLRYGAPVLVLAGAAALSLFALPDLQDGGDSRIVASAVALDLTVAVPGLVFFLLVRTRRAPWIAVVPAFVVGYAVAVATLPDQHQGILEKIRLAAVPAELILVTYLVWLTRKALASAPRGAGDVATRFRALARRVLGSRIPADILTTEMMILHYAFRWRTRPAKSADSFTVHRRAGYLAVLIGLAMVLVAETIALHLLVSQWSRAGAWILTGLSLYALIWITGDYRAIVARPMLMAPTHLSMRLGIRWEADFPIDQISQSSLLEPHRETRTRDILVAALLGQPNLKVRLKEPVEVIGMYGLRRTVGELWLRVDDAETLCEGLRHLLDPRRPG